ITAPGADTMLSDSTPVELVATATDEEDGELSASIQWSSSLDGVLGSGASKSARLSVGGHTITATAQDTAGAAGQADVTVTVAVGDAAESSGSGSGCDAGSGAGLAAACASLLASFVRRRRRRRA